jgi:hypothetical protein
MYPSASVNFHRAIGPAMTAFSVLSRVWSLAMKVVPKCDVGVAMGLRRVLRGVIIGA